MMNLPSCHLYLVARNVTVQKPDPRLAPTMKMTFTLRNQTAIGNVDQCLSENRKHIPGGRREIGRWSSLRVKVKVLLRRV